MVLKYPQARDIIYERARAIKCKTALSSFQERNFPPPATAQLQMNLFLPESSSSTLKIKKKWSTASAA